MRKQTGQSKDENNSRPIRRRVFLTSLAAAGAVMIAVSAFAQAVITKEFGSEFDMVQARIASFDIVVAGPASDLSRLVSLHNKGLPCGRFLTRGQRRSIGQVCGY
jgi:hypothetical protein